MACFETSGSCFFGLLLDNLWDVDFNVGEGFVSGFIHILLKSLRKLQILRRM